MTLIVVLIPSAHASTTYWFQVGAFAADNEALYAIGASVEINVHSEQPQGATLSYWVGMILANGAFIQVGYLIEPRSGSAIWFWAYFTQNNDYVEHDGSYITAGWTNFSIVRSNAEWTTYLNMQPIGEVNLGITDSGYNTPVAIAENPQVTAPTAKLGPVEFQDLQYRTHNETWYLAKAGKAYVGYGGGSAKLPDDVKYPYGISFQKGRDNYWIAGSASSSAEDGQIIWPWYQVQVSSAAGFAVTDPSPTGWYPYGNRTTITITVPRSVETGRGQLTFWYWSINNQKALLTTANDGLNETARFNLNSSLNISATYRLQNFL